MRAPFYESDGQRFSKAHHYLDIAGEPSVTFPHPPRDLARGRARHAAWGRAVHRLRGGAGGELAATTGPWGPTSEPCGHRRHV